MEILNLKTNSLNQNNYSVNKNTPDFIGSLVLYPVDVLPDKCLPCDGFKLKIDDYKLLHDAIGSKFNDGSEEIDEFRIPNYNITKRFLQPGNGKTVGNFVDAGLPDITGYLQSGTNLASAFSGSGGAFSLEQWVGQAYSNGGGQANYRIARFKASASNPIYNKSETVQPPSQVVHVCIRYK